MKAKIFTLGVGMMLLVVPALVLADAPAQTLAQLTATLAAVQAQEASVSSGNTLACAALFSGKSVHSNEPVALAWGSVGSVHQTSDTKNMWTPNGSAMVSLGQVGTWTYYFTFYGTNGGSTTCTASITVLPAQ